jgi:hypothetical protein
MDRILFPRMRRSFGKCVDLPGVKGRVTKIRDTKRVWRDLPQSSRNPNQECVTQSRVILTNTEDQII